MALLTHRTIDDAAKASGIATKTLLRWLQIPEFEAAYRKARRAGFSQCVARLQQASSAAVSTLLKVMVDPNTPAASRVRAAGCVLDRQKGQDRLIAPLATVLGVVAFTPAHLLTEQPL